MHYRLGSGGVFCDGLLIVLRNELRILEFDQAKFRETLKYANLEHFKQHKIVYTVKESDIVEMLVMEQVQRVMMRTSKLISSNVKF